MAGTPKSLRINGIEFAYASDCTPKVIQGGRQITDKQTFSDGTSEAVESVIGGSITGNKVTVRDGKYSQFESLLGKKKLPIIYEASDMSAEFTGFIKTPDGFSIDSTTNITEEFDLICQTQKMNIVYKSN